MIVTRGQFFTHKKKGTRYVIDGVCQVKVDGLWVAGVMYKAVPAADSMPIYVRTLSNFESKFTEDRT